MKPRNWMRLVVPGLCVGMLPACANPTMNAPKAQAFPGQFRPNPETNYGPPQAPGYSSAMANYPPQLNYWNQQPASALPVRPNYPYNGVSGVGQVFESGRALSPYPTIQYDPSLAPTHSVPEANVKSTLDPSASGTAEMNTGSISVLPNDKILKLTVGSEPSPDAETPTLPPLTLPEAPRDSAAPGKLPATLTDESIILDAVKRSLEKRPDDVREALKSLDPAQREILMTLIPLTIRVGEGGLASADPREVALVVDQLEGLLWALRPRAALVMDKFCFCRKIRSFGRIEPLEDKPSFRPGEMVEVYAEIRNVSSQPHRTKQADFQTHLRSKLEIRESAGGVVYVWKCDKTDATLTPQHDYYQHYRLQIPEARPGTYVLNLEAEDVPTGRKVNQKLVFRVTERE